MMISTKYANWAFFKTFLPGLRYFQPVVYRVAALSCAFLQQPATPPVTIPTELRLEIRNPQPLPRIPCVGSRIPCF